MKRAADPSGLDVFEDARTRLAAQRMGMWIFLATELMIFGGLFLAIFVVRWQHPAAAAEASGHLSKWIGAGNTAILLTSSLLVAIGAERAKAGGRRSVAAPYAGAALLGLVFLAVKIGVEYRKEFHEGLMPGTDKISPLHAPAGELFMNLYFTATGLHAIHVAIGILVLGGFSLGTARRWLKTPANAPEIEFAGLYWHVVDVIWIFLFPALYLVS